MKDNFEINIVTHFTPCYAGTMIQVNWIHYDEETKTQNGGAYRNWETDYGESYCKIHRFLTANKLTIDAKKMAAKWVKENYKTNNIEFIYDEYTFDYKKFDWDYERENNENY